MPPTVKKPNKSLDRIIGNSTVAAMEGDERLQLPSIKSPEIMSNKHNFVLSFEKKNRLRNRPNSLLRNSSNNPVEQLLPLDVHLDIQKKYKYAEGRLSSLIKKPCETKPISKISTFKQLDKENINSNIEEPVPRDGFSETFSKLGSIPAPEPFKRLPQGGAGRANQPPIEIKTLEESSDDDTDFVRSTSEISNNEGKAKITPNQSA